MVLLGDSRSVVAHFNELETAIKQLDVDDGGPGIERVLDEFLDGRADIHDDLPTANLAHRGGINRTNAHRMHQPACRIDLCRSGYGPDSEATTRNTQGDRPDCFFPFFSREKHCLCEFSVCEDNHRTIQMAGNVHF